MAEFEITNMIMVQNPNTLEVVVQERVKYWCGATLPGGHVEPDESIYDSAVREVKEETGLSVKSLVPCGFMNWYNNKNGDRYFVYFYKTTDYSGELIDATDEGKVFWASLDELKKMQLPPNFREYLVMFTENKYSECFCSWNDDIKPDITKPNPWGIVYR